VYSYPLWGGRVFPSFLVLYIYIIYIIIRVRNGGFFTTPVFQKPYFQILFFSTKESKEGKPRIELSPANKKKKRTSSNVRIELSPANKKEKRMCSNARIEFSCE
jgi:hypothetical protein